jgi:hypothetical protein
MSPLVCLLFLLGVRLSICNCHARPKRTHWALKGGGFGREGGKAEEAQLCTAAEISLNLSLSVNSKLEPFVFLPRNTCGTLES